MEQAPRLLSVNEAASMLGLKASTLYRWAEERKLPVVKFGRSVRFRLKDIERFITTNLHPALRELDEQRAELRGAPVTFTL